MKTLLRILLLTVLLVEAPVLGIADANQLSERPGSGYKGIGRADLVAAAGKYDGRQIWTVGIVRFASDMPYLGDSSKTAGQDARYVVCLQTIPEQVPILRQLSSLSVGVWGIYHRRAEGASRTCPNGAITVQSIEISFE
jgi:hypothetical protein